MRARTLTVLAGALALAVAIRAPQAFAASDQQDVVVKARLTVEKMLSSPDLPTLQGWVRRSKAVLVVPSLLKAGFIFGGSGGTGVLLAHHPDGTWSSPAFFRVWSASFGAQIGVQDSQVMFVVMTQSGLDAILHGKIKLGADASIAVGPKGAGIEGATTVAAGPDIYSYALASGAFAGVSFEGAFLQSLSDWNRDYYGRAISARAIVLDNAASNPNAEPLIRAFETTRPPGPAPQQGTTPQGTMRQDTTQGRAPGAGPVTTTTLPPSKP